MTALQSTHLAGLECLHRGKVRDLYAVGPHLLMVATDRISAFDVVLEPPIPDKGRVLTQLSLFWFDQLGSIVGNHVLERDVSAMPPEVRRHADVLEGRALLVKRLSMLPAECVARGYLAGSAWKDYQRTGAVCGHALPSGLPRAARLDPPLFTPSTKATEGHDENIDRNRLIELVGIDDASFLEQTTLALYARAREIAEQRGIILADTKLEFGRDETGRILLGDEAFTPDSSRFWQSGDWRPGHEPKGFDKQPVRNWLDAEGWDHSPPAPRLTPAVVAETRATYREIYERLTGAPLS